MINCIKRVYLNLIPRVTIKRLTQFVIRYIVSLVEHFPTSEYKLRQFWRKIVDIIYILVLISYINNLILNSIEKMFFQIKTNQRTINLNLSYVCLMQKMDIESVIKISSLTTICKVVLKNNIMQS